MGVFPVFLHCPCYKSPADISGSVLATGESVDSSRSTAVGDDDDAYLSPSDSRVPFSLYGLEEMYFCDDCHVMRCPRCVMEEVVSIFCPNCLLEVPGKSNPVDSHCPRNCFKCPLCQTNMQKVGDESMGYKLECTHCHYDSTIPGLSFPRSTGLTSQITVQKPNSQLIAFSMAKDRFEFDQKQAEREHESEGARILRQYRTAVGKTTPEDIREPFLPPLLQFDDQDFEIVALLSTGSLKKRANMIQRQMQKCSGATTEKDLLPVPFELRTKRTKRCRQCRSLLVKPDPKPMSINFRSRLYANRILPTMEFKALRSSQLIPHITSQWALKLTNPLVESCSFTLSTATKTDSGDQIIILCPEFTIGPTSEVWEETNMPMQTSSSHGELHECGRNYASVILELVAAPRSIPTCKTTEDESATKVIEGEVKVKFSVFVQMHYEMDAEDPLVGEGSRLHDKKQKVKKEIGFWAVLEAGASS